MPTSQKPASGITSGWPTNRELRYSSQIRCRILEWMRMWQTIRVSALGRHVHRDLLCFLILCSVQTAHPPVVTAKTVPVHPGTDWQLKPSLKYDTLCLLNALSGDPYYLEYYRAEY